MELTRSGSIGDICRRSSRRVVLDFRCSFKADWQRGRKRRKKESVHFSWRIFLTVIAFAFAWESQLKHSGVGRTAAKRKIEELRRVRKSMINFVTCGRGVRLAHARYVQHIYMWKQAAGKRCNFVPHGSCTRRIKIDRIRFWCKLASRRERIGGDVVCQRKDSHIDLPCHRTQCKYMY